MTVFLNGIDFPRSHFLIIGPQKEVVSIYNNNFITPKSRVPYFIEVYRCVILVDDNCGSTEYPVPSNTTEIEVVVLDFKTKYDRDPPKKTFYKYVVYNHTSCKCGTLKERENSTKISNETVKIRKTHMCSF